MQNKVYIYSNKDVFEYSYLNIQVKMLMLLSKKKGEKKIMYLILSPSQNQNVLNKLHFIDLILKCGNVSAFEGENCIIYDNKIKKNSEKFSFYIVLILIFCVTSTTFIVMIEQAKAWVGNCIN